jgi:hypothetical protein
MACSAHESLWSGAVQLLLNEDGVYKIEWVLMQLFDIFDTWMFPS